MTVTREPATGLVTSSQVGQIVETYSYNAFGELARHDATIGGTTLYSVEYDSAAYPRDALGRVRRKTETRQE